MRLGGTEQIKVDVRIVAASNIDLLTLVREGRFRKHCSTVRISARETRIIPLRASVTDVEQFSSDISLQHLNVLELITRNRKYISIYHNEVGQFSNL